MAKATQRDGVFQRKDRYGWWISYVNAERVRRKEKVEAHTRTQALSALSAVKTRVERDNVLGVKAASDITTIDLLARYKRYQKSRLSSTTFERLDGILETLKTHLPERAKDITRKAVADLISSRSEKIAAGTIAKETTVLKHALKLAVE